MVSSIHGSLISKKKKIQKKRSTKIKKPLIIIILNQILIFKFVGYAIVNIRIVDFILFPIFFFFFFSLFIIRNENSQVTQYETL